MITASHIRENYVRRLPSAFCPGCGDGQIVNAIARAIDHMQLPRKEVAAVSGIGCSAWIPSPYLRVDTLHTTHGRAVPFAVGLKSANPRLKVLVVSGDGDCAGIGGNHLIHAARSNIDLTVLMVNNGIYGMTGGQVAPTTEHNTRTSTTMYGNPSFPMNVSGVVAAAGASYVARWTTWHMPQLIRSIEKAMTKKGFSFIEIMSQCPTYEGKVLGMDHLEILHMFRDEFKTTAEGHFKIGEFVDTEREEFTDELGKIIERAKQ